MLGFVNDGEKIGEEPFFAAERLRVRLQIHKNYQRHAASMVQAEGGIAMSCSQQSTFAKSLWPGGDEPNDRSFCLSA